MKGVEKMLINRKLFCRLEWLLRVIEYSPYNMFFLREKNEKDDGFVALLEELLEREIEVEVFRAGKHYNYMIKTDKFTEEEIDKFKNFYEYMKFMM